MMFCAVEAPGERVQKVKEVQSLQDEPWQAVVRGLRVGR